jgi:hypothetical protein
VLSGRGLCDGLIPRPEEFYRLWCVSECDQVKINNLDTCCEQVGSRGKDCETKRIWCNDDTAETLRIHTYIHTLCDTKNITADVVWFN